MATESIVFNIGFPKGENEYVIMIYYDEFIASFKTISTQLKSEKVVLEYIHDFLFMNEYETYNKIYVKRKIRGYEFLDNNEYDIKNFLKF